MTRKLIAIALTALLLGGCNYYKTADTGYHVIVAAVSAGEAELQPYLAAGITSPAENAVLDSFYHSLLALATTMDACNERAKPVNTKQAFIACAQPLAAALANPATLAGLRVINPRAQAKVQVYIIAVVGGINVVLTALGAPAALVPTVATTLPVSSAEVTALERHIKLEVTEHSR
jgi:predicted small secreted protein